MPRSEADFRAKLDAARVWEKRLSAWVRARGWFVLPTYDFGGKGDDKAPKLLAPPGLADLVMPDLQCFRDGNVRWIEVKWKARADLYRNGGYRVTGISERLFKHYTKVEALSRQSVVVVFIHKAEQEVRGATLSQLSSRFSHTYSGHLMGESGMRFWRYDEIPLLCSIERIAEAA